MFESVPVSFSNVQAGEENCVGVGVCGCMFAFYTGKTVSSTISITKLATSSVGPETERLRPQVLSLICFQKTDVKIRPSWCSCYYLQSFLLHFISCYTPCMVFYVAQVNVEVCLAVTQESTPGSFDSTCPDSVVG